MGKQTIRFFLQWVVATATAATVGLSYFQGYVYPRTEGERNESDIIRNASRIDKNTERYDRILEILLEIKRRQS